MNNATGNRQINGSREGDKAMMNNTTHQQSVAPVPSRRGRRILTSMIGLMAALVALVPALVLAPAAQAAPPKALSLDSPTSNPDARTGEKVTSGRENIETGGSIVVEAEDSSGREVLTTLRIRGGHFDYGTATGEIHLLYRNADGQTTTKPYPVEWVEKWGPNIEFGIDLPFIGPDNEGRFAYFETEVPGLEWNMGFYEGGLLAPGSHPGISQIEADVMMMQVR
ncbi:MAG: hypothetical protein KDC39_09545 [Actinobacteria bacterium]|nr:hypothetical protein [Actinomycetota bacterium]